MVLIDKWPLFAGYIVLFNKERVIEMWPLFTGWSLFGGGLYHRFDCFGHFRNLTKIFWLVNTTCCAKEPQPYLKGQGRICS